MGFIGWRQRVRDLNVIPLLSLVGIFLAVNARWIWLYRHGLALDIDEAGYLDFSFADYFALHDAGWSGWIAAIEMPSIQAPLTTALTSLLYAIAGPHVIVAFAVPLAAGAACIVGAYVLGRIVGSSRVALMAAVLTASCPVIINYSRSYQFSMLTTAITTFALIALLRSHRLRRLGWTLAFGACLGLMPLARTMALAFIPGLVIAAGMNLAADPGGRRRRVLNLCAALMLAAVIAAAWLWPNGRLVGDYLLDFGYGNHALEYGASASKLGLNGWLLTTRAFCADIYLPHLIFIIMAAFVLVGCTLMNAVRRGAISTARLIVQSSMLPVTVYVTTVIFALASSSNKGSGFFAPAVPALFVLSSWALDRIARVPFTRAFLIALVAAVTLTATVPLIDLHMPFSPLITANLPVLGDVTVSDGRGNIQRYEADGWGRPGVAEPLGVAESRAWVAFSAVTAAEIRQQFGQRATIIFGFRNRLYNVNSLNLQELLQTHSAFGVRQIDPVVTGESVTGYRSWLQSEGIDACALLISAAANGDFPPIVNWNFLQQAAHEMNFVPDRQWPAPDGEKITVWVPAFQRPGCH